MVDTIVTKALVYAEKTHGYSKVEPMIVKFYGGRMPYSNSRARKFNGIKKKWNGETTIGVVPNSAR